MVNTVDCARFTQDTPLISLHAPPPAATSKLGADGVGVVEVRRLEAHAPDNAPFAVDALCEARALILDLRGCVGSAPSAADALSGRLLTGKRPLAILIDSQTGAAGTRVAAHLQSIGQAVVVGPPNAPLPFHAREVDLRLQVTASPETTHRMVLRMARALCDSRGGFAPPESPPLR